MIYLIVDTTCPPAAKFAKCKSQQQDPIDKLHLSERDNTVRKQGKLESCFVCADFRVFFCLPIFEDSKFDYFHSSNKCHASSNRCLTSSNKKLCLALSHAFAQSAHNDRFRVRLRRIKTHILHSTFRVHRCFVL